MNYDIDASVSASIAGSLEWLKVESIGKAGRKFSKEKLKKRKYMNMRADNFFHHCYDIRSRLVHSNNDNKPQRQDVSKAYMELMPFVSDLLTSTYLSLPDRHAH